VVVKDRFLKLWDHLRRFNRKISIKVRLARIRRAKVETFKDLGEAIFNLVVNKVYDISKSPAVKELVEELTEQDREISKLNLELKQR